jgi:hypothetical protein
MNYMPILSSNICISTPLFPTNETLAFGIEAMFIKFEKSSMQSIGVFRNFKKKTLPKPNTRKKPRFFE